MTNKKHGTLYTGSTDNIEARVYQHKNKVVDGFTKRYGLGRLVYFEAHDTREDAKLRERQIKEWQRLWKIEMIEKMNPDWNDLLPLA